MLLRLYDTLRGQKPVDFSVEEVEQVLDLAKDIDRMDRYTGEKTERGRCGGHCRDRHLIQRGCKRKSGRI